MFTYYIVSAIVCFIVLLIATFMALGMSAFPTEQSGKGDLITLICMVAIISLIPVINTIVAVVSLGFALWAIRNIYRIRSSI